MLHLPIGVGEYITEYPRVQATGLSPHERNKAQEMLSKAKTNRALKAKSQPDGEEVCRLLPNWSLMAKIMRVSSQARDVIEEKSVLPTHMYRKEFNPRVLKCTGVAKCFQRIIYPTIGSAYLVWLRKDTKKLLTSIQPWGAVIPCGDIVETINYIHKYGYLRKSACGGGGKAVNGNDKALTNHTNDRAFLCKELVRCDGQPKKDDAIHLQRLADGAQSDSEV